MFLQGGRTHRPQRGQHVARLHLLQPLPADDGRRRPRPLRRDRPAASRWRWRGEHGAGIRLPGRGAARQSAGTPSTPPGTTSPARRSTATRSTGSSVRSPGGCAAGGEDAGGRASASACCCGTAIALNAPWTASWNGRNSPRTDARSSGSIPNIDRAEMFTNGYVAPKSGHSRGSAVDLTLYRLDTGELAADGRRPRPHGRASHHGARGVSASKPRTAGRLCSIMEAQRLRAVRPRMVALRARATSPTPTPTSTSPSPRCRRCDSVPATPPLPPVAGCTGPTCGSRAPRSTPAPCGPGRSSCRSSPPATGTTTSPTPSRPAPRPRSPVVRSAHWAFPRAAP